jgi:curved DNA-binding protein CbpA
MKQCNIQGSLSSTIIDLSSNFLNQKSSKFLFRFRKFFRVYDDEYEIVAMLRNDARHFVQGELIQKIDGAISELSKLKLSRLANRLLENLCELSENEKEQIKERCRKIEMAEQLLDYYAILGVSRNATYQEIKTAYRAAARQHHPDKNRPICAEETEKVNDLMSRINEAHKILLNSEEKKRYDQKLKSAGWNCFDIAVGINRNDLIEYALYNNTDEFRELLAPEIRHAAALTAVYMNGYEGANEERAYRLAKLFNLMEILKGNDKEGDVTKQLSREANEILDEDKLAELEQNILPKSMRKEQLQQLINAYLEDTNNDTHEQNLQMYCMAPRTYKQYIRNYYGKRGWVAFQRSFLGETNTSMIDIAARMLNKVIIIYQENQEIYRTQNRGTTGEIEINYNGTNHFERRGTETNTQHAELDISHSTFFRSGNHEESTNCVLSQQPDLTLEEIQTNYASELGKADVSLQQMSRENLLDEHDLHESDRETVECGNDNKDGEEKNCELSL